MIILVTHKLAIDKWLKYIEDYIVETKSIKMSSVLVQRGLNWDPSAAGDTVGPLRYTAGSVKCWPLAGELYSYRKCAMHMTTMAILNCYSARQIYPPYGHLP